MPRSTKQRVRYSPAHQVRETHAEARTENSVARLQYLDAPLPVGPDRHVFHLGLKNDCRDDAIDCCGFAEDDANQVLARYPRRFHRGSHKTASREEDAPANERENVAISMCQYPRALARSRTRHARCSLPSGTRHRQSDGQRATERGPHVGADVPEDKAHVLVVDHGRALTSPKLFSPCRTLPRPTSLTLARG